MSVRPNINYKLIGDAAAAAETDIWMKFPQLKDWIIGKKKPTVLQLADFAKSVHIPFGFFFLEKLPEKRNTLPLFRTNSNIPHFDYSNELRETIQIIQGRQAWLLDFLKSEQNDELSFVGRFNVESDYLKIANDIRNEINLTANWTQNLKDKDDSLKFLIKKVEDIGIYVAMNGVVGNSNNSLDPHEFKGFVLSNRWAPYIFINGKDYPAAKIFTLMHELVHIWLDESAVLDIDNMMPANTAIEKLCDAVAAELLVPKDIITEEWNKFKHRKDHLEYLERIFKVSKIVIARRLLDLEFYSKPDFFEFYNNYKVDWENRKVHNNGGGSFYANQTYRVGIKFFEKIKYAAASGKLLYSDAYKLTNLYGSTFNNFSTKLER